MPGFVSTLSAWAAAVALIFPSSGTSVGTVSVVPGPVVPVVVQHGDDVLLPGGKQIQLAVSRDYGACESFLSTSRDGRWLAWTTPSGDLRITDLHTTSAYSLGTGCDPTWGPDGRLAYLRATTVSLTQATYRSVILVRRTPRAQPVVWASGQLWGLVWAGDRLAYNRTRTSYPHQQVSVASGPAASRTIPTTAGRDDPLLIAASPDGRRLLVQVDRVVNHYVRSFEQLVDVTTGKVLSEISARYEGLGSGVWVGDQVVATVGVAAGQSSHPGAGLVRLTTTGDRLKVEQVRDLDPGSDGLGDGLADLHDTGHGTVAVTRYQRTASLLSCRVSTLACTTVLSLG